VEAGRLERAEEGWAVDGEPFEGVVLALPAWRAAALLAPTDEELARLLGEIGFVGVVVVSFAFDRSAWTEPWEGFGILSPRSERYRMLGCLLESSTFPHRAPEGQVLLRVLAGGAHDPGAASEDEEALVRQFRDEVRHLLGPKGDPRTLRVWRYERCLPQYRLGHADRVEAIEARLGSLPGLRLTGNSYRGISVPDCIADGEATARSLL
jgi:oxygen-dependent protoporphyrinogen oxidase